MNRRGFLKGILAAGVAPYVCTSGVLMPVRDLWKPPVLSLDWYTPLRGGSGIINWIAVTGPGWLQPGDEITIGEMKERYVVVSKPWDTVAELRRAE